MLRRIFHPRRPNLRTAVADEVLAMCNTTQIGRLGLSAHMQKDIGADCGCIDLPGGGQRR